MVSSDSVSSDSVSLPTLPAWDAVWQSSCNWLPNSAQTHQFQALYHLILAGNQHLNLTRITDPLEFLEKHLWDSLSGIAPWLEAEAGTTIALPAAAHVIDIGTGAGFPGVPIAIAQPNWAVTLLDSTRKKLLFLDQTLSTLAITNAKTWLGRAEAIGQDRQHREQYDLASIRAVAGATVCAEYTLPLLKVGGVAVLYRGQWTAAEEAALHFAVQPLGGCVDRVVALKTPITSSDRHCIYVQKIHSTPSEFPRMVGIPAQKPLGIAEPDA